MKILEKLKAGPHRVADTLRIVPSKLFVAIKIIINATKGGAAHKNFFFPAQKHNECIGNQYL